MSADYPERSRWERLRSERWRLGALSAAVYYQDRDGYDRPRVLWRAWLPGRSYAGPYRSAGPAAVRRQKRVKRALARSHRTAAWSRAHP